MTDPHVVHGRSGRPKSGREREIGGLDVVEMRFDVVQAVRATIAFELDAALVREGAGPDGSGQRHDSLADCAERQILT